MDVRSRASRPGADSTGVGARAQSFLSMYADQPEDEVTLEDFEICAFDRLKVLRAIESSKARGVKLGELNREAYTLAKKHIGEDLSDPLTWRRDMISHHILRLAFCNTEEKRKWFITHETALFSARLRRESSEGVAWFMGRHNLNFTPLDDEDKRAVLADLRTVWDAVGGSDNIHEEQAAGFEPEVFENATFFKVPFIQAMDLVKGRRVLLRSGYAYVPRGRMLAIIANRFTAYLRHMLIVSNRFLPTALTDERLKPMLEHMSEAYTGPEYGQRKNSDKLRAEDVDQVAATAMPMCAQSLHEGLRGANHLQHDGRQQYGLFLKGAGLDLAEALVFWRQSFSKKFTPDEFLKKYAYNIRHNYGQEGKRANYSPPNCVRIIQGTIPGKDQHHGCPYKHWNTEQLKASLGKMRIPERAIDDILSSVRTKDFQIACRKQFDARFTAEDNGPVGNHPNAYTEAALGYLKRTTAGAGAGAGVIPSVRPPAGFVAASSPLAAAVSVAGPHPPIAGAGADMTDA